MTDPLSTSPSEALRASRQRQDFETAANLLGVGLLMPTTKRLADGTTGWLVRFPRGDDCWPRRWPPASRSRSRRFTTPRSTRGYVEARPPTRSFKR